MCTQLDLLLLLACTSCMAHYGLIIGGDKPTPLGRPLTEGVWDQVSVCTANGVACQNCTHSVSCVSLPGGWLKVPLKHCEGGLKCSFGQCSDKPVAECEA